MTKTAGEALVEALEAEVLELVQNGLILYADRPALAVASLLWSDSRGTDSQIVIDHWARALTIRYFVQVIKSERRKAHPKPETAPLFPGLDNLPRRIVTSEGKRPLLAKATATEIRGYVKSLNAKHRERIAGLQTVLEHMEKYTRTNRGLTAAEVAKMEAES